MNWFNNLLDECSFNIMFPDTKGLDAKAYERRLLEHRDKNPERVKEFLKVFDKAYRQYKKKGT